MRDGGATRSSVANRMPCQEYMEPKTFDLSWIQKLAYTRIILTVERNTEFTNQTYQHLSGYLWTLIPTYHGKSMGQRVIRADRRWQRPPQSIQTLTSMATHITSIPCTAHSMKPNRDWLQTWTTRRWRTGNHLIIHFDSTVASNLVLEADWA